VMVSEGGAVRVMDFGLASEPLADRAEPRVPPLFGAGALPSPATLTRTGTWVGTPLYMAPEQFRAERADARTDQFSFCVALYEALYGERPFQSESLPELQAKVLAGRIGDPSPRSRVPAWLRKVILRGLSVDRAARYPSMRELLSALERDPARTRRRLAAGAALGLLLLAGGAVAQRITAGGGADLCQDAQEKLGGVWELPEQNGDRPRRTATRAAFEATGRPHAAASWERAAAGLDEFARRWIAMHKQSCEATHKSGEQSSTVLDLRTDCLNVAREGLRALADLFQRADGEVVAGAGNAVAALPDLNRCADLRLLREVVPPPRKAEQKARVDDLRKRLAAVRAIGDVGKWVQSLRDAERLVADAQHIQYAPVLAEALYLRGMAEAQTGNAPKALETLKGALPTAVAAHDDLLAAQVGVVIAYTAAAASDRPEEVEPWASLSEAYLGRTGLAGDRTRAWLKQARGVASLSLGNFREAVAFQREAATLSQKATGR
jgi:tetratricopeptide (TPR) repeat protein